MTTTLFVIRHGETAWNAEKRIQGQANSDLSPLGQRQAAALAERMARVEFDILLSSDLPRALHTAQFIAVACNHQVVPEPALRERNFGAFQGLTWEEIQHAYPDEHAAYRDGPDYAPPGGESVRHFHDRVLECAFRLVAEYGGQRLVLVTHGGVLSVLFKYTVGLDYQAPSKILPAQRQPQYLYRYRWTLEITAMGRYRALRPLICKGLIALSFSSSFSFSFSSSSYSYSYSSSYSYSLPPRWRHPARCQQKFQHSVDRAPLAPGTSIRAVIIPDRTGMEQ